MNYDHNFHAGCFADIFKHSMYLDIIKKIQSSNHTITIYDMHAAGHLLYNIYSTYALRSGEFLNGIIKLSWLYKNVSDLDDIFSHFYGIVLKVNDGKMIKLYPGSAYISSSFLRQNDRAILCEKNPKHYHSLKKDIEQTWPDKNIECNMIDAWSLNDIQQSPKNYSIILIDPPFEDKDELTQIENFLYKFKNFDNITILIWYPVKEKFNHRQFSFVKHVPAKYKTIYEASKNQLSTGISGTGMILISNILLPSYSAFTQQFSHHFLDAGSAQQYHL